jgi:hypothetical protein
MAKQQPEVADAADNGEDFEGGFLDVNFDEIPEIEAQVEGEYELVVEKAKLGRAKKEPNDPYLMLYIGFADVPTGKTFTEVLMLPGEDSDTKERYERLGRVKKTATAFGVDISRGLNVADFENQRTWALVGETEDKQYGKGNRVVQFLGQR